MEYTLFPPLIRPETTTSVRTTTTTTTTTTQKPDYRTAAPGSSAWNTADGWSIALIVLTTIRLVLTLCLWTYLTYGTVRARTRLSLVWPHQLLLAVLALSHGLLYAFALVPTPLVCGALRLCLGLIYATMFGVLMLKLIVIAANDKGYEVPRNGQIILLILVTGVQLGLSLQWVLLIPPDVVVDGPQWRTCDTSVSEWLGHLSYVGILLVAATGLALAIHDVKADRRESMFLGLAVGLNVPVLAGFFVATGLGSGARGGRDAEKLLAFALLASTSVVLFVMFLPRSRQLSAMGESGLYTEDVAVVKPMSELTVHKLYYPVYEEQQQPQRRLSAASSMTASRRTAADFVYANDDELQVSPEYCRVESPSHELVETGMSTSGHQGHQPRTSSNHWYPPLRSSMRGGTGAPPAGPSLRHYQYPSPGVVNHLDHYTTGNIRRVRLVGVQEFGPSGSSSRCLTPPSEDEEGSSGTSSPCAIRDNNRDGGGGADDASDLDNDDQDRLAASEFDIADFRERNVNGVSYTSSVHVVNGSICRQPVY